jgi:LysR family transcriptional activator of dmlA
MSRINVDLLDAQAFLEVLEHGGFAAAARALNISQSTISRRVAQLEARIGQRLVERTTRSLLVTPVGEQYAAGLRDALQRLAELERTVTRQSQECDGPFSISIPAGFAAEFAFVLAELTEHFPKLELHFDMSTRDPDLVGGEFDMAIRFGEPRRSGVEVKRLREERMLILATPEHLAARPVTSRLDLIDRRCITSDDHKPKVIWRVHHAGGVQPLEINPLLRASHAEIRRDLGLLGCGVVAVSEFLAAKHLKSGRLVEVLPGETLPPIPVYLQWARHRRALPAVRLVRAFLEQRLSA